MVSKNPENIKKTPNRSISSFYEYLIFGLLLIGLYLSSFYNFLVFHALAELFSIVISWCVFLIGWQSRKYINNSFYLIIGVSFLFVGILDLFHTLAYAGMNIFTSYDTNLSTQLWLSARYLQAFSLLIAIGFSDKLIDTNKVLIPYLVVSFLLMTLIFTGNYPDTYIEGQGLTLFKIISEYLIILLISLSLILIHYYRSNFEINMFQYLTISFLIMIFSEFMFTLYVEPFGLLNLLGHIFKIVSYYFIFKVFIQIALANPFSLFFKNLKTREEIIQDERDRFMNILDSMHESVCLIEKDRSISYFNKQFKKVFGTPKDENCFHIFYGRSEPCEDCDLSQILKGNTRHFQYQNSSQDGRTVLYDIINTPYENFDGSLSKLKIMRNITAQNELETELEKSQKKYQSIIENMPLGIHIYEVREDNELYLIDANQVADELLNLKNQPLIGKPIIDAFPEISKTQVPEQFLRIAKEGGYIKNDEIVYQTDQIKGVFENFNFQISQNLMASIFNDISEQYNVKKELEKYRLKLEDLVVERTKKLNETMNKLKEAQRIAHLGNWEWDLQNNIFSCSEEVYEIFGFPPSSYDYNTLMAAIHPEDREKVLKSIKSAIKNNSTFQVEHRVILPEGSEKIVNEIGESMLQNDGKSRKIVGTIQDITKLREAEIKFQDFKESIPDGLIIYNEDLKFLNINQVGLALFPEGTSKEDLMGKYITEIVPNIEKTERYRLYLKVLETSQSITFSNLVNPELFGETHFFLRAFKLGKNLGLIFSDITELIETQVKLKEYQEHLEEILKSRNEEIYNLSKFPNENPHPVARIKSDQITYANQSAINFLKLKVDYHVPPYLKTLLKKANETKNVVAEEFDIDDSVFLITMIQIRGADYINLYGVEITPIIEYQEKLHSFLSNISHELRTPLTVLNQSFSNLEEFEEEMSVEEKHDFFDTISRNIDILNDYIEDMITVSRTDESRLDLNYEECNLSEVLENSIDMLIPKANQKNIKINANLQENVVVKADKRRIAQILRILIDNAIKYSDTDSRVIVNLKKIDSTQNIGEINDGVSIKVIDKGRGIHEDDMKRLFERFHRGKNVKDISGTGLGLTIAKELVELHKGNIQVSSKLNEGSTFSVFLPVKPPSLR